MKIKLHSNRGANRDDDGGVAVAERPSAGRTRQVKSDTDVITKRNFDTGVMYVGRRIRSAAIRHQALGVDLPHLREDGFLIVKGDKPGILIHPVKWDGEEIYQRTDTKGGARFGTLKALNSTHHKGYRAEIIDEDELRARLIKKNHIVKVKNVKTDKTHTVALLNNFGELYIAGVEVHGKKLVPINMEPKAHYNKPDVQYVEPTDVKMDVKKFLP